MYYFAMHSGMPGYLPNSTDLFEAADINEAKTTIRNEVERWIGALDDIGQSEHLPWAHFPKGPDASTWSFDCARCGAEVLSVAGLTHAEYETRMDEQD